MYRIKAPTETYERSIGGVRFVRGVAATENEWLAQWFSGRAGFSVECVADDKTEQEGEVQDEQGTGTGENPGGNRRRSKRAGSPDAG